MSISQRASSEQGLTMARRPKHKMLTTIPSKFDPNFIERLNRNYTLAKIVQARRDELIEHCGGTPSYVQHSLIKRALWLELIIEAQEQKFANAEVTDVGAFTQASNTLLGIYKILRITPEAKKVPRALEYAASLAAKGSDS